MKHLEELGKVLTNKKLSRLETFENINSRQQNSLLGSFLDGILNNKFSSDAEAANDLYGFDEKSEKYRKLKSRLSHKLLNSILLIKPASGILSVEEENQLSIKRHLVIIHILVHLGAKKNALKLSRKTLNQALQIKDHDAIIELAQHIRDLNIETRSLTERVKLDALILKHHSLKHQELKVSQFISDVDYYLALEYPSEELAYNKVMASLDNHQTIDEDELPETVATQLNLRKVLLEFTKENYPAVIQSSLQDLGKQSAKKTSNKHPDYTRLQELYFLSLLKTSASGEGLKKWLDIAQNKHLSSSIKARLCSFHIYHSLEQEQYQQAIELFNEASQNKSIASIIQSSDKWMAIYLYLCYFRLRSNIISPVQRLSKMPRIDYLDDLRKLQLKRKEKGMILTIHIGLLKILCSRHKNILKQEIEGLNTIDTKDLPRRFAILMKLLAKWESSNFDEPKGSWAKDFSILSQTNFLNSQNLNTFEPINLGKMLGDVFEMHTLNGKILAQQF